MDKAKAAVSDFVKKHGQKDTTVHENVAPAVTHETIRPSKHEEVTTAVDKEVHQDHYHTSVQPIKDREVLPETHKHNIVPVENRTFTHGDTKDTERRVQDEAARFADSRTVKDTVHTHEAAPTVGGEHTHHHVHETIQPVVQRETIQPEVVHTTVPVHEVHHNAAQHHAASALPAVSMSEFKTKGGSLTGRGERTDAFEGEPKVSSSSTGLGSSSTGTTGLGSSSHTGHSSHTGTTGTTGYDSTTGSTGYGSTTGTSGSTGLGSTGHTSHTGATGTTGTTGSGYDSTNTSGTTGTKKPSLMDKLNPNVDSNGDGKAGFMK